ncbi:YybH family protein [Georgenia yuyongxinii]
MSTSQFDDAVEGYREGLRLFVEGDPEPCWRMFSEDDEVTLANPLGPPRRGPAEVRRTMLAAVANFQEGGAFRFDEVTTQFEEIARHAASDLGYVVQLERSEGRLAGRDETVVIELRVTMVFRREDDGTWKVAHRHADPITTDRPLSTAVRGAG